VHQLIYTSQAASPFDAPALRALLTLARARNTAANVSGMLLHVDGSFLQVLEGEADVVVALFDKIGRDVRHRRVITLLAREIEPRNFADWSMGFFDGSGRAASAPGYRATNGFADLGGDPAALVRIVGEFRDGRWRQLAA
jgi:hypothetical protein